MNFDTIVALATPTGVGGIGIVRLSGAEALKISKCFFKLPELVQSHRAYFGKIKDADEIVDSCLLIYFKSPKSFTGEDIVEFHCHGNPYITNKVIDLCLKYGARLAQAGEFTKRAFLNGKLDLTQAEAVYDLIHSKTSVSLKNANNQMGGKLSGRIRSVREKLIKMLSHIEAIIDFPDEIDDEPLTNFEPLIKESSELVKNLIDTAEAGKIYREGLKVAIVGKPNAGKSSLLNALVRFDRAIVTEIAGTTRDTLEEYINIKGIPVKIVDTAGLRETQDRIEKIGIEKSFEMIDQAQLVLFITDGLQKLDAEELLILDKIENEKPFILVVNKIDLSDNLALASKTIKNVAFISAKYNKGIEKLETQMHDLILDGKTDSSLDININNRHKEILYRANESLDRALMTIQNNLPIDFLTIDTKSAVISMGEVIGENVTEEIITEIFANFCVGK